MALSLSAACGVVSSVGAEVASMAAAAVAVAAELSSLLSLSRRVRFLSCVTAGDDVSMPGCAGVFSSPPPPPAPSFRSSLAGRFVLRGDEEAGAEDDEAAVEGRSRNLTITHVMLSQPVPSPVVSGARHVSNNCAANKHRNEPRVSGFRDFGISGFLSLYYF